MVQYEEEDEEVPMLSLAPPILQAHIVRRTDYFRPFGADPHYGVDYSCIEGRPIFAPVTGLATRREQPSGFGRYVRIETPTHVAFLCHGSDWLIDASQQVIAGQEVMRSGNTGNSSGPHLHFEVRDKRGSPYLNGSINPEPLIVWPVIVPPVVVPPIEALHQFIGTEMQQYIIPLNANAALEKAGAAKGYLPGSDEERLVKDGVTYVCQMFRNSADRTIQHHAYCVEGDWGEITWFTRPN